mgnify:CR=1 FL=1
MKLGCCASLWEDRILKLPAAGADYAEAGFSSLMGKSLDQVRARAAQLEKAGVSLESMNVLFPGDFRLTGPQADFSAVDSYLEENLPKAQALGVKVVVFGSGGARRVPEGFPQEEAFAQLVELCREHDMGFIAMKGLSGGLLNNAEACYAFMQEHPDVVPIWGIQHEWELDQWLELTERNPRMTPELQAVIDHDRTELSGDFCRSCGYCLPCAAGIDIPQAARMAQLLRRAPYKPYLSDEWREKMHQIKNCIHCNACKSRCPYGLDTPALLQKQLAD